MEPKFLKAALVQMNWVLEEISTALDMADQERKGNRLNGLPSYLQDYREGCAKISVLVDLLNRKNDEDCDKLPTFCDNERC